ncbi:hypothetical protein FOC1_g10000710, partial [Fusarium oxysporum f. sp. cubense race 1]
ITLQEGKIVFIWFAKTSRQDRDAWKKDPTYNNGKVRSLRVGYSVALLRYLEGLRTQIALSHLLSVCGVTKVWYRSEDDMPHTNMSRLEDFNQRILDSYPGQLYILNST